MQPQVEFACLHFLVIVMPICLGIGFFVNGLSYLPNEKVKAMNEFMWSAFCIGVPFFGFWSLTFPVMRKIFSF